MINSAFEPPASEQTISAAELRVMREQWKEFRRFRRKSVILACVLETSRGNVQSVALDLSLGGARVRVQGRVEPQEQVTLVLAKFGRFPGEIVWRNASEAGLQFKDSPEEVLLRFGNDIPFD